MDKLALVRFSTTKGAFIDGKQGFIAKKCKDAMDFLSIV